MSTLYFPILLCQTVPNAPLLPILLLKVNERQAALAFHDTKTFFALILEPAYERAVEILLELGYRFIPPHTASFEILKPDVAAEFTTLVLRAPPDIISQFEIDISTLDLREQCRA